MNEDLAYILDNELSFFNAYIKQFKKHLNDNNIILVGDNKILEKTIVENNLVINKENYSGIIIYELNNQVIDELRNNKYNNEAKLLIIDSNKEYDLEVINFLLKDLYELEEEFIGDDKWKFLLYKKNTIK